MSDDAERPPLTVRILVHELRTGEIVREHNADMSNRGTRGWLFKLVVWAYSNGMSVEILNPNDEPLIIN